LRSITSAFRTCGDRGHPGEHPQGDLEAVGEGGSAELSLDEANARLLRVYVDAIAEFGRSYDGELTLPARALVQALVREGAPLVANGTLTELLAAPAAATLDLDDHTRLSRPEAMRAHLRRINPGVRDDPAATIASCKELLESACKFVLEDYEVAYSSKDDVLLLYKKAAEALRLKRRVGVR
jgi:hypothetical protein